MQDLQWSLGVVFAVCEDAARTGHITLAQEEEIAENAIKAHFPNGTRFEVV